jgi:hypothetical protein
MCHKSLFLSLLFISITACADDVSYVDRGADSPPVEDDSISSVTATVCPPSLPTGGCDPEVDTDVCFYPDAPCDARVFCGGEYDLQEGEYYYSWTQGAPAQGSSCESLGETCAFYFFDDPGGGLRNGAPPRFAPMRVGGSPRARTTPSFAALVPANCQNQEPRAAPTTTNGTTAPTASRRHAGSRWRPSNA